MQLSPYLNFKGECEEAFRFYETTFGGTIKSMFRFGDTEMKDHVPAELHNTIMHAFLVVGDWELMGSDAPPERYQAPQGMYVSLNSDNPDEADRMFTALAEGGQVQMPIQETSWAQRFGMLVDRFGIPWMINCEKTR